MLSKKSLDEALMYYPSIFKQMQSAADEMKYQLHKGDLQINTFKKPGSAGETFLRTGCKLFDVEPMHFFFLCQIRHTIHDIQSTRNFFTAHIK